MELAKARLYSHASIAKKKKYLHAALIIQCLRSAVHKASFELDLIRYSKR